MFQQTNPTLQFYSMPVHSGLTRVQTFNRPLYEMVGEQETEITKTAFRRSGNPGIKPPNYQITSQLTNHNVTVWYHQTIKASLIIFAKHFLSNRTRCLCRIIASFSRDNNFIYDIHIWHDIYMTYVEICPFHGTLALSLTSQIIIITLIKIIVIIIITSTRKKSQC